MFVMEELKQRITREASKVKQYQNRIKTMSKQQEK